MKKQHEHIHTHTNKIRKKTKTFTELHTLVAAIVANCKNKNSVVVTLNNYVTHEISNSNNCLKVIIANENVLMC